IADAVGTPAHWKALGYGAHILLHAGSDGAVGVAAVSSDYGRGYAAGAGVYCAVAGGAGWGCGALRFGGARPGYVWSGRVSKFPCCLQGLNYGNRWRLSHPILRLR